MKKLSTVIMLSCSILLVACGDKEDTSNVPDNAPVEQENNTTNQTNKTKETKETKETAKVSYNFTHFELDIDYAQNKSYEVNYENEATGAEAKIEDDLNNKKYEGNAAMDLLIPIFESLTFDSSTVDDKVINEVLQKFNVDTNFQQFELEVKFADGTIKEYRTTK